MGDKTGISWADSTWNPIVGCSKVSAGCANCYAFDLHGMRHKAKLEGKQLPEQYAKPFGDIQTFPDRLYQPLRWRRPRRIFVNSLSDLFHPGVPDYFIWSVFETMAHSPHHTFQILTKRPERMAEMLAGRYWRDLGTLERPFFARIIKGEHRAGDVPFLPNVWIGVTVENQQAADERIPLLLETPAAVRFLSCEPLLGSVDLSRWLMTPGWVPSYYDPDNIHGYPNAEPTNEYINWVIVGGESGSKARPMHPDAARSLRDQCQAAGVPFHFKQWGEWAEADCGNFDITKHQVRLMNRTGADHNKTPHEKVPSDAVLMARIGKKAAGRMLDGRTWDEFPGGDK